VLTPGVAIASGEQKRSANRYGRILARSADRVLRWKLLLPFSVMDTASAYACTFVDEQAAATHAEVVAGKYWIASILLGGVLIGLELYQRQGWFFLVLTVALLIFHPYRTLPPVHGPDCVFANVESSQFVLAIISFMFAYRLLSRGFVLVEDEELVEVDEFETDDPALRGEMRITFTLVDANGCTDLRAVHEELPSGLSSADNQTGWRMALAERER